jgi:Fe-S cluster biogenesis protein NfuA
LIAIEDDGVVVVKLLGACVGCPSAGMTLQTGIEENLKTHVPGVTGVRAMQ